VVRAAYRDLAAARGWVVVDADGSPDEVAARVLAAVRPVLP
jgi:thymidylate kinase